MEMRKDKPFDKGCTHHIRAYLHLRGGLVEHILAYSEITYNQHTPSNKTKLISR